MVEDGFRSVGRRRGVRNEGVHGLLESRELLAQLRRGPGISVEPSLDEFDLIGEMDGRRAKGRGVEGSLF